MIARPRDHTRGGDVKDAGERREATDEDDSEGDRGAGGRGDGGEASSGRELGN